MGVDDESDFKRGLSLIAYVIACACNLYLVINAMQKPDYTMAILAAVGLIASVVILVARVRNDR